MHKTCSKCRVEKPLDDFYKRSDRPGKYFSACKSCQQERNTKYYNSGGKEVRMKSKYGVSYNDLFVQQGGTCKICQKKFDQLCIDHDHNTEQVRALLCHNCNVMLGHSLENISTLANAITYLNEHAGAEGSSVTASNQQLERNFSTRQPYS